MQNNFNGIVNNIILKWLNIFILNLQFYFNLHKFNFVKLIITNVCFLKFYLVSKLILSVFFFWGIQAFYLHDYEYDYDNDY